MTTTGVPHQGRALGKARVHPHPLRSSEVGIDAYGAVSPLGSLMELGCSHAPCVVPKGVPRACVRGLHKLGSPPRPGQ